MTRNCEILFKCGCRLLVQKLDMSWCIIRQLFDCTNLPMGWDEIWAFRYVPLTYQIVQFAKQHCVLYLKSIEHYIHLLKRKWQTTGFISIQDKYSRARVSELGRTTHPFGWMLQSRAGKFRWSTSWTGKWWSPVQWFNRNHPTIKCIEANGLSSCYQRAFGNWRSHAQMLLYTSLNQVLLCQFRWKARIYRVETIELSVVTGKTRWSLCQKGDEAMFQGGKYVDLTILNDSMEPESYFGLVLNHKPKVELPVYNLLLLV